MSSVDYPQINGEVNMNTVHDAYKRLAERLDNLPNGFPPTEDGAELKLLAKLYTPEEAELASQLLIKLELAAQVASRLGLDYGITRQLLKGMARKGLIKAGKADDGLGYGLLPFVVGIYENQTGSALDEELARLFEDYYQRAFTQILTVQPAFHRVIPVGESIKMDMMVAPYESAAGIIENAKSWAVSGLHLPQAKGSDRPSMPTPCGRVHGDERYSGCLHHERSHKSAHQGRSLCSLAPGRPGRLGAFGEQ